MLYKHLPRFCKILYHWQNGKALKRVALPSAFDSYFELFGFEFFFYYVWILDFLCFGANATDKRYTPWNVHISYQSHIYSTLVIMYLIFRTEQAIYNDLNFRNFPQQSLNAHVWALEQSPGFDPQSWPSANPGWRIGEALYLGGFQVIIRKACGWRVWIVPRSLHVKDPFCSFRRRAG